MPLPNDAPDSFLGIEFEPEPDPDFPTLGYAVLACILGCGLIAAIGLVVTCKVLQ